MVYGKLYLYLLAFTKAQSWTGCFVEYKSAAALSENRTNVRSRSACSNNPSTAKIGKFKTG